MRPPRWKRSFAAVATALATTLGASALLASTAWASSNGTVDEPFVTALGSGFNNPVHTVSEQADGKVLVGGEFTSVNGVSAPGLARLNADGGVDTAFTQQLGAGSGGVLASTVQADGKIVVAGTFSSIGGVMSNGVARFNPDGTLDTAFSANIADGFRMGGVPQYITTQPDGKILVTGGSIREYNGAPSAGLIRLNADGTQDTAFQANLGIRFWNDFRDLAVLDDGSILIAGASEFVFVDGQPVFVPGIAKISPDGIVDTAFEANARAATHLEFRVAFEVQDDGRIVLGGQDSSFWDAQVQLPKSSSSSSRTGIPQVFLERLMPDGTADPSFAPTPVASTDFLSVATLGIQSDGKIVVGGNFATADDGKVTLARYESDGSIDPTFSPMLESDYEGLFTQFVERLVLTADDDIIAGGSFTSLQGPTISHLVKFRSFVAPQIVTTTLPVGDQNASYTAQLEATGEGPLSWSIAAGQLPAGLILDPATGAITGTPTANGEFPVTITVTGSGGTNSREFTLVVIGSDIVPLLPQVNPGSSSTAQPTPSAATPGSGQNTTNNTDGAAAAQAGQRGGLAATGVEAAVLIAVSLAVVGAGAAIAFVAYRRRAALAHHED